jgi:hypothetical protein
LINEDLETWTEIHDWIRGLTFPTNFEEYVNLSRQSPGVVARSNLTRQPPVYSDASLTFFTNKNNPSFRIKFADVFPTSLSTITFSTGDTAENIMTADATFRFSYYNYERI